MRITLCFWWYRMPECGRLPEIPFRSPRYSIRRRGAPGMPFAQRKRPTPRATPSLSVQRLDEALVIDPDFPEAHSDLAAIYAHTGRLDEAMEHAETAFKLNPQLPEAGCNFALLLVSLKRYPEAEIAARHMLSGGYYVSVLHGVLAISLIEQRKDINEALEHLKQAVTELPFVRLLAAHALAESGRPDLAVNQVKEYLRLSAHDCERPALEAWLTSVQARLMSEK